MIITSKFVFIHIPKTGGTFVRDKLKTIDENHLEFFVKDFIELKHAGVSKIPEEYKKLPIVCCIRDPESYIVSRFNFQWWMKDPEKRFNMKQTKVSYPNFPDLSIEDFYDLMCNPYFRNDKKINKWRLLAFNNSIGTYTTSYLSKIIPNPSKVFKLLKTENENKFALKINKRLSKINFLRTENLSNDLYFFLKKFNTFDENLLKKIRESSKIIPKNDPRLNSNESKSKLKKIKTKNDILSTSLKEKINFRERFMINFINTLV